MRNRTTYAMPEGKNIREMAGMIQTWLKHAEGMDARILITEGSQYIIQARSANSRVMQWLGLDRAVRARITECGNRVFLETDNGGWRKKALVMVAGMIILWPLVLTAGAGMVMQARLPGKVDRAIRVYLGTGCMQGYPGPYGSEPYTSVFTDSGTE